VISAFFYNATRNAPLQIHGDGNQTRDFVYVTDVANANLLAASSDAVNSMVNIGSGRETSINELAMLIKKTALSDSSIEHDAPRVSDGRRSLADIRNAKRIINYEPKIRIDEGLAKLSRFFGDTR
jgi:UDP-glucose 4-epimerase